MAASRVIGNQVCVSDLPRNVAGLWSGWRGVGRGLDL